jgi:predicted solute-binding protein
LAYNTADKGCRITYASEIYDNITPIFNEGLCTEIATTTGLKVSRIKQYYQKIEYEFVT